MPVTTRPENYFAPAQRPKWHWRNCRREPQCGLHISRRFARLV